MSMEITGRLRQDLIDGKVVIFLGAGASQAAGLHGTAKLAEYLFNAAGSPLKYQEEKSDLAHLVARLDGDPSFTRRRWVDSKLIEYFLERSNYSNLDLHRALLKLPLAAVFTTNYDYSLEFASGETGQIAKLVPIWDGSQKHEINHPPIGCLPYYKIHGCCHALRNHPSNAPSLVITREDFRKSVSRKQYFYERLGYLSFECSIVFIGFQAQREESDQMVSFILDVYNSSMNSGHTDFRPFAVLPHLTDKTRRDLEDAGLTPLEGSFEDFIKAANEIILSNHTPKETSKESAERNIAFTVQGKKFHISKGELEQYSTQFICLHDGLKEELKNNLASVQNTRISEMWKSDPSNTLLAGDYYIERDEFPDYVDALKTAIEQVEKNKTAAQIVWLVGKRGSGKSVVAHQLAWHAYYTFGQPTIKLVSDASYAIEMSDGKTIEVSGWNEQLIDKFLSLSSSHSEDDFQEDNSRVVPIILADHVVYRANVLERLLHYLEEHKKPCVLLLTISDEELGMAQQDGLLGGPSRYITRLTRMFSGHSMEIDYKLTDGEINRLFRVAANLDSHISSNEDRLIWMAKDKSYCDRDFLLILYTWFDKRFRRFEEIIADEIAILEQDEEFKQLYLSMAVFHRYHFQPRLALCATAMGLSNDSYSILRQKPLFKAFINVLQPGTNILQAVGTTRHVEFSRQIVGRSMPGTEDQINLMAKVLSHCKDIDLEFARDFMNYLYEVGLGLTYEQIRKLKEATEEGLEDDYVLNHQFAAYLIRDTLDLRLAQYYLERANDEFPGNPSIIHSFGNLCFRQYRELLPNNPEEAREYFNTAREYLARSRALQYGEEEHGYYTEIVMLKHRLEKEQDPKNVRATIEAERHALLFEALRVVPNARQNLLRGQFGHERPFHQLPSDEQQLLKNQILSGEASHMLLEYYGNSLLSRPKTWTWKALRTLIDTYWARASSDFPIAVIICLLAKQAFIKNAQTRFNLLQTYYENTIQFNKAVIDFVLLAEYTRLLMVDAFVLGRYNFLRNSVVDLLELYRQKKPRFLGDEYILKDEFYQFDENDAEQNLNHFENYPNNIWSNSRHSERFERIAYISGSRKDRYVRIELDEITHYFVRAPRQEIATFGNAQLNFAVKYTPDGFFATDFIT